MNEFQRYCKGRLEAALAPHGIEPVFDRLPGDPDPTGPTPDRSGHYRAQIGRGGRLIEIYLYQNEAAFRTQRNWYVFEQRRYDGPEPLVDALVRELEEWLSA